MCYAALLSHHHLYYTVLTIHKQDTDYYTRKTTQYEEHEPPLHYWQTLLNIGVNSMQEGIDPAPHLIRSYDMHLPHDKPLDDVLVSTILLSFH
jgi:hypothetical protein